MLKATASYLSNPVGTPHEGTVVNTSALRTRASETLSALESRTNDQMQAAFEKRRELAMTAGVADLATIEGDYYTLNLYRDNPTLDFVEMRNLPLGTIPIYRTRYENPVNVFQGGLAGHGSTNYYATSDTVTQVTPFTVSTEEVMLPNLNNIYNMEMLQQRATGLRRLAEYMKMAITNISLNTMLGTAGTDLIAMDPAAQIVTYFSGGGSFIGKNVYKLDPGVLQAGVPSLNVYDLTTEGGLTKNVFKTINTQRIQLGKTVKKIYVAAAGAPWESMITQASVVALSAGQGNQDPRKAVTETQWEAFNNMDFGGTVTANWFGMNVEIEKQNWLPAGYAIVLFDGPTCIMWDRLSLESGGVPEGTLESPVSGYYSRRSEARNIAFVRPDFMLKNFMVLKIQ